MNKTRSVVLVSGATAFSLLGDQVLYAVLPVLYQDLGLTAIQVGILLSANRWIRLLLNGPAGALYDRWPRRRLLLFGLFLIIINRLSGLILPGASKYLIDEVIASSPDQVQQFKDGKEAVFGYLVGQAMKLSKGKANPAQVNQVLRDKLK